MSVQTLAVVNELKSFKQAYAAAEEARAAAEKKKPEAVAGTQSKTAGAGMHAFVAFV